MLNMQLYMHNTHLAQFDNKMWKMKRERTCATNFKKKIQIYKKKMYFLMPHTPEL